MLLWKHRGLRRFGERVSAALGKLGRALLWGRALSHFGAWAFTALATPGPPLLWGHWGLRCFANTMASALCGRALRPLGTPGLRRFGARASSTLAARGLRHFVAGPFAALGHGPQCFGDLGASTNLGQGPPPLWGHAGFHRSGARTSAPLGTPRPPPFFGGGLRCFGHNGTSAALAKEPPPLLAHRCLCRFGAGASTALRKRGLLRFGDH